MTDYALTAADIRSMLETLSGKDRHIAAAVELVGFPNERRIEHGFKTLLSVIAGQQLSVKAAATIRERVYALMTDGVSPAALMALEDEPLRGAGLSRQKILYARSLAVEIMEGRLDFDALPHMSDADTMKVITAVKGLGRWSAEMYMMFALGRADVWPVDDLAVRVGVGRIIGHEDRPTPKALDEIGERWRPYRSAVALLAWHYYSNAPL